MVGVVPRNGSVGGLQHRLGLFIVAVSRFGILGEHGYELEQPPGREAVGHHLAVESTREKGVVLIVLSRSDVNLGRGVAGENVIASARRCRAGVEGDDRDESSGENREQTFWRYHFHDRMGWVCWSYTQCRSIMTGALSAIPGVFEGK